MKRLKYILLMLLSLFIFTSCDLQSNEDRCNSYIDKIIESLDNKDASKLKDLFSEYVVSNDSNLDTDIENLVAYYNGKKTSTYEWCKNKESHYSNGKSYICIMKFH